MYTHSAHHSYAPQKCHAPLIATLFVLLAAGCASNNGASAVDKHPAAFWPPFPDEPRIQYLTSYQASPDVQPAKSKFDELVYGKEPEQVLAINKPYGVEMWNGRIYVCDFRNATVSVFDLRNHRMLVLGKTPGDALQTPVDIAIASDGTKYVADQGRGVIAVYDAQDRRVGDFAIKDLKPVGVAVFQNQVYVCDFQTPRVVVMNRQNGSVVRTIGEPGGGPGQFVRPLGITVDKQGFVYVMDFMKCQLQKFDPQGKYVSGFGTITAVAGGLVRPKHIDVDSNGVLYVVDAAFQNVQLFDPTGQVLTFFGSAGTHQGAMYLPAGICVHEGDLDLFAKYIHPNFQAERLILVTNQFGPNKVSVYAMGHLKAGKTVKDISASKGLVPSGTEDKGAAPATIPTTLPSDLGVDPATAGPLSPGAPATGPAPAAGPAPVAK